MRPDDDFVGSMVADLLGADVGPVMPPPPEPALQYPEIASRWLYSARDGQTMPVDVANALEAFRLECRAVVDEQGRQALGQYDAMVRQDMAGFTKRREAEQALAGYITDTVVPVAMPHERDKLLDMAKDMAHCRTSGEHGIAIDTGGKVVGKMVRWVEKCGFPKLCPDESRVEGQRIAERYLPLVAQWLSDGPKRRVYYAVLTEPNYPVGGLHDGKRASFKRFHNLLERVRDTKATRQRVGDIQGALVVQEDPLSAAGTWNGHLNVILLVDGDFSYKAFREEWGYNVEVQHIKPADMARSFIELCKYQAKAVSVGTTKDNQPGMVDWEPALWLEWWRANTGFRRTRAYGVLHGAPTPTPTLSLTQKVWLGRVRWTGSRYSVEHYDTALSYVDLIQGDKSGKLRPKRAKKYRKRHGGYDPGGDSDGYTSSMVGAMGLEEVG